MKIERTTHMILTKRIILYSVQYFGEIYQLQGLYISQICVFIDRFTATSFDHAETGISLNICL